MGRMANFVTTLKNGVAEGVASEVNDFTPHRISSMLVLLIVFAEIKPALPSSVLDATGMYILVAGCCPGIHSTLQPSLQ